MKLTRRKAIEICIELWTWLAETGDLKHNWDGWKKYEEMQSSCPFCEYVEAVGATRESANCYLACPIVRTYRKDCFRIGFVDWDCAETKTTRKKYAKLFLERLEEIK